MEKTAIRFCEGRINEYAVSSYISEFLNTMSSIVIQVIGMQGRKSEASTFLVFNGIGSMFFHATFFEWAKFLDEMTMMWCLCIVIHYLRSPIAVVFLMWSNVLLINYLDWTGYAFRFLFGITFIYMLHIVYEQRRYLSTKVLIQSSLLMSMGIGFWITDELFCSSFYFFHSLWHICMALGAKLLIDEVYKHYHLV